MSAKIRPLFKWFGSKWMGAKHYPSPISENIYEPFAGSAGYSLNHVDKKITIWEDNDQLIALWTWLIKDATTQSIKEIPINVAEGTGIRELGLSSGQALLLKHWQRTNNVGDCWTISPWGNKPGQWTANTRARVAEEVNAIKHWMLAPTTYLVPGTYFIDPPYQFNYRYRFAKDSFSYESLVGSIQAIPAPSLIIACEAACSKTGAVPNYLPFQTSHRQITSRRKTTNNHHSSELVYCSERLS